jgi:hypothetical protein
MSARFGSIDEPPVQIFRSRQQAIGVDINTFRAVDIVYLALLVLWYIRAKSCDIVMTRQGTIHGTGTAVPLLEADTVICARIASV